MALSFNRKNKMKNKENNDILVKILKTLRLIDCRSSHLFNQWADNAKRFEKVNEEERNAIGDMILTIRKTKEALKDYFINLEENEDNK